MDNFNKTPTLLNNIFDKIAVRLQSPEEKTNVKKNNKNKKGDGQSPQEGPGGKGVVSQRVTPVVDTETLI